MRCLVTGGCGFIGSHVVDALIKARHDVTVVDNLSTGKEENLNPKARFIEFDIVKKEFWEHTLPTIDKMNGLDKYDYIFHLAALARIQPSIVLPVPAHEANVNGSLNVLEYCRRHGAKLIFSSSSSIYSGDILPTGENHPKRFKNPYSLQKYIGELYIELYARLYGLEYAILRYFNVYGDRQLLEGAYATVIGIFLQEKNRGKPLSITFDGEQRRDFTHVDDVVKANLMAMSWKGTYNIGAGKNYSINEIADMVGGKKKYIGNKQGEVRNTLADNSKAKSEGWSPIPNALEDYLYERAT